MLNQSMLALGTKRSCIRELFEYGLKQARYWLQDEQRYQTVYDFIITNKERES